MSAAVLLSLTNPHLTLDGALFEVISAFATCGLTLAYTPVVNGFGRYLLILVMIWGRLGALTIIVALARPVKASLYVYPEEPIMIG
jgi:trk system potassium uptake protein